MDCLVTLEKILIFDITVDNIGFNILVSCSSSQECNKRILQPLIDCTENDNQLLGFSFIMQLLTEEYDVAVLFRNG